MDANEFSVLRKHLKKTQKEIAQLLGTSLKAIHSYEQGWRNIPPGVERQMLFLLANRRGNKIPRKSCWVVNNCPPKHKEKCPAWEFQCGKMCWFVSGTICGGEPEENWESKMKRCRACDILKEIIETVESE
ncbi:MAG: transcriptional regulator [Deltaproteobacteria bacterium]|nr:transcriptional regulator [Deltaproteobacteria bacterium]